MTILTVSELREYIETDLADPALQRLADASEEQIINRAGSASNVTEDFSDTDHRILSISRPVSAIVSIKERDDPDGVQTTLSANDYRVTGTRDIIRLREGDNPRLVWAPEVEVVYTPVVDTNLRIHVQIQLVKLALNYSGAATEKEGDFSVKFYDTRTETRGILAQLMHAGSHRLIT